jgi:hypothetical protein
VTKADVAVGAKKETGSWLVLQDYNPTSSFLWAPL